jgi:hypothetical protein
MGAEGVNSNIHLGNVGQCCSKNSGGKEVDFVDLVDFSVDLVDFEFSTARRSQLGKSEVNMENRKKR